MARLRNSYLLLISAIGLVLIVVGLSYIPLYEETTNLALIAFLAIAAQGTITFTDRGGYISVGSAISLSTVPLYGPFAAVLIAALSEFTPWLISLRQNPSGWRGAFERLGFNIGMSTTAALLAGLTFLGVQGLLGADSFWGQAVPWLPAAIVSDQVNLWLLVTILYLANGVKPREAWQEHRWAIPLNLLLTTAGGAVLSVATKQFGYLGILIFFLPIILSAYAFRLYVNKAREQMDRLEELVSTRTQELAGANNQLKELHKEKDAFLTVLTHDMRSPLTSIHGFASMLRDRPDMPPEKQRRMVDIILRSEAALLEIVNNILDIEKLESGTPVLLDRDHFDLADLVQDSMELVEPQAEEKEIHLRLQPVAEPIYVQADRQKLQRVMQNLISNAVKYTPSSGGVCVSVQRNGRYAIVQVSDTGYGIPADELPFIFDRFRRVAGHKNIAVGTGLGLAIVRNLVEAHEGLISVESEVDKGSTFTVKLPL